MAGEAKEKPSGSPALLVGLVVVAIALGGLCVYLNAQTERAQEARDRAVEEYREMVNMKQVIERLRHLVPRRSSGSEDRGNPLQYLSQKARQAQVPADKFNVTRNQTVKIGPWQETPYTISLRGKKDEPVPRDPVVDFLRLVEEQRPSIKSKNLNLNFQDDSFTATTITFSSFQRQASGATGATPPK